MMMSMAGNGGMNGSNIGNVRNGGAASISAKKLLLLTILDFLKENGFVSLSSDQRWKRPPPGWCKINFYSSFHSDCAHANIAVVGKNNEGEFLGGKVGRVKTNTFGEAEALAAELAVDFALQK
ncbi:hypothetical protein IFM89_024121 [Coptis chinensis]|uniref:Uncharacterized protein n=1 Tax=Coptis chinensis TaxID=261450 RepID=A0A835I3P7_9MAGN|nr:hypothetical protein IFM89_024121 [Coptis chinensis]